MSSDHNNEGNMQQSPIADIASGLALVDAVDFAPPSLPRMADFDGDWIAWLGARAEWATTPEGRAFDDERNAGLRETESIASRVEQAQRKRAARALAMQHSDTSRHADGASFANYDGSRSERQRKALESVKGWAERTLSGEWRHGPVRTLILGGPVGTGKSHLMIAACRYLAEQGRSVQIWNASDLIKATNPFAHEGRDGTYQVERIVRDCIEADVLAIDDMGSRTATLTENQLETQFRIFNGRMPRGKWTIATTNVGEIAKMIGGADGADKTDVSRIASRIGDGGHLLQIGGRWDGSAWVRTTDDQRGRA